MSSLLPSFLLQAMDFRKTFYFAEILFIQISANPEAPVSELEVQKAAKTYSDKGYCINLQLMPE